MPTWQEAELRLSWNKPVGKQAKKNPTGIAWTLPADDIEPDIKHSINDGAAKSGFARVLCPACRCLAWQGTDPPL
ncbi:hypothetical protein CS8_093390 [Cupriavidus sp. 8B]